MKIKEKDLENFLKSNATSVAFLFSKYGIKSPKVSYNVADLKNAVKLWGGGFVSGLTDIYYEKVIVPASSHSNFGGLGGGTGFGGLGNNTGGFSIGLGNETSGNGVPAGEFSLKDKGDSTIDKNKKKASLFSGILGGLGGVIDIFGKITNSAKKGVEVVNDARNGGSENRQFNDIQLRELELAKIKQANNQRNLLLIVGAAFVVILIVLITRKK